MGSLGLCGNLSEFPIVSLSLTVGIPPYVVAALRRQGQRRANQPLAPGASATGPVTRLAHTPACGRTALLSILPKSTRFAFHPCLDVMRCASVSRNRTSRPLSSTDSRLAGDRQSRSLRMVFSSGRPPGRAMAEKMHERVSRSPTVDPGDRRASASRAGPRIEAHDRLRGRGRWRARRLPTDAPARRN
jgi:hypothetical protein